MGTVYDARNDSTEATLNAHGNSINAIKAGRLLGVVAAGGGGNGVQQQALSIAAMQSQDYVQHDIRWVKDEMQFVRSLFCEEQERDQATRRAVQHEVERLAIVNTNMQTQLNTLEDCINRMTQRAGPSDEANPPPRPRRVLPASFGGLRGGAQILRQDLERQDDHSQRHQHH